MASTEGTSPLPSSAAAQQLTSVIEALAAELHRHPPAAGSIGLETDLDRDLGMDSLARVELLHRVEERFDRKLEEERFIAARTVKDVLAALTGTTEAERVVVEHEKPIAASRHRVDAAPATRSTLPEVLEWHAAAHPGRVHIRLYDDQTEGEAITYLGLLEEARQKAAALQARGLRPGEPVVLMLQTGRDYFVCFFGVLLAGGIPVPIYPPARPSQLEDHIRRQQGILANCEAGILVTLPEARMVARLMLASSPTLRHVVTPDELAASGEDYVRPAFRADDLALLQYTSGSTGQPKGVMLTHANLLANIRLMVAQVHGSSEDVFVSWLPLYHDMGLIGAWLGSLYCAAEFVVMSPLAFIARPERWLWAIHRHRATLSASPNFGYELCVRRLDDAQLAGLDLRSWRIAFNGAEPVSPETLRRFVDRFEPYGLRRGAPTPVYGLAECSLGLTFPPLDRGPLVDRVRREPLLRDGRAVPTAVDDKAALQFVSCGSPIPGHELRIVDDAGRELPEREVGRLQFRGPSATRGYYRNAEATRALRHGDWLDSGDLAYVAAGETYLTGRVKDIVIHAGRNLYPHELEEAVGTLPGIRSGRVAAFGSRDPSLGTERLVVVAETHERDEPSRQRLRMEINRVAGELTGSPPDDIVLAPPGAILKTPSGKIRRTALKERYEAGEILKRPPAPWTQMIRLVIAGLPGRLRRLGRRAATFFYGVYALLLFGLFASLTWLAVALLPTPGLRWRTTRAAAGVLAALTGVRLRVLGTEHLPATAAVIVANHASYLDGAFVMMAIRRPAGFVAKGELQRHAAIRMFLSRLGAEFVERLDARQGVEDIRGLARLIERGRSLTFFPEGTFTRAPGLRPFRMGAFVAAAEAGAPVVPVALRGTRSLLRSGSWWPSPGEVVVTIGTPVMATPHAAGADTWTAAVSLRDQARAHILRHCGEPDLSADRSRPWLGESPS